MFLTVSAVSLVLALAFVSICCHKMLIDLIPFLGTRKFTSRVLPEWNKMVHTKPVSWRMREIVIPCPDLLYSMMKYDISNGRGLRITLADATYQNLGFYDQNARCVQTKSYVAKGGSVIAVSEAAAADMSHAPTLLRLPIEKGYVLYRVLVENRSAISKTVATQRSMAVDVIPFVPKTTTGKRPIRLADHLAAIFGALIVAVFVACVTLGWNIFSLSVYFTAAAAIGIITAILIAARLRSTSAVGTAADDANIGSWSITYLQDQRSNLNLYAYLRFFFHGALGLPSSEVIYATAIKDFTANELRSDHSYVVEAPTVDFSCNWWSITVYGHDKFLVQNDADIYSVVSTSLANNTNGLRIYLSRHKPAHNSAYSSLPWIPLASGSVKEREFRLIFRAYLPDQSVWNPTAVQSLRLPTITRVD